jgi:1,4-alpha-glucan branching enzyme
MGNEFGHPEWIDFPRQGNNWSYHYARRQWRLKDDPNLCYRFLDLFDRDMIHLAEAIGLLASNHIQHLWEHNDDKIIIFQRAEYIFAFNFHPSRSFSDYQFQVPSGEYRIVLNSDDTMYGGYGRVDNAVHHSTEQPARHDRPNDHAWRRLSLYLPNRTALVLAPVRPTTPNSV